MLILIIMGIALSFSNFRHTKTNAAEVFAGTLIINNDGTTTCEGAPLNCTIGESFNLPPQKTSSKASKAPLNKENSQKGGGDKLNIVPIEGIKFSPKSKLPEDAKDFCVTKDELFIIPDNIAGNIKIYEIKGKFLELIQIIGRKGYEKFEFSHPSFCFYDESESRLGVIDNRKRTVYLYSRIGRTRFVFDQSFRCPRGVSAIQLSGNKLLISGFAFSKQKVQYDLYSIDLNSKEITFLLPSQHKYGIGDIKEYQFQYRSKVAPIGINGWVVVQNNFAYFVWEGDLRITKIDLHSMDMVVFGKKTPHYITPYPKVNLIKAYYSGNFSLLVREKAKMSYLRKIYANQSYVYVIYEGPNNPQKSSKFMIQLYNTEGDFLGEKPILGNPNRRMWLDRKTNTLYSLTGKPGNEKGYSIRRYRINM
jgi:hypothetical protein